jgi:hypothetical protein
MMDVDVMDVFSLLCVAEADRYLGVGASAAARMIERRCGMALEQAPLYRLFSGLIVPITDH